MSKISFSKHNIISYIFFIISPILGVIFSFSNLSKPKYRKCFYIIISFFFGLFFLKNPPIHDIYRYYLQYEYIYTISDFGKYTNDYFFDTICLIFNQIGIPFYFIPPLFVFLTLYITLIGVEKLILKYKFNLLRLTLLIISSIILTNPVLVSLGLRSYLSFAFLFLGLINYFIYNKKLSFILFFLSGFTHSSLIVFIIPLFLINIIKPGKVATLVISFICFLFSYFLISIITNLSIVNLLSDSLVAYTEISRVSEKSISGVIHYYLNLNLKLIIIIFAIMFIKIEELNIFEKKLYYYMNYMLIICSLCSVSDVALGRYSTYTSFISFILLFFCNKKLYLGKKLIRFILIMYVIFNLMVNNIYINRHIFMIGKPIEMSIITPLALILYSEEEYKKYLINIDNEGYPISGSGSRQL